MNVDRAVLTVAGSMVLLSLALAWLVSPYWLLLTAFVGLNLLQAAFTGFCPAAIIFRKLGLKTGSAFDRHHLPQAGPEDRFRIRVPAGHALTDPARSKQVLLPAVAHARLQNLRPMRLTLRGS